LLAESIICHDAAEVEVTLPDGPFDEFLSVEWLRQTFFLSDKRTWSSLLLVVILHSALACLLWYSPKPLVPIRNWMEVKLVSMGPSAKEGMGGDEAAPVQQPAAMEVPKPAVPPADVKKADTRPKPHLKNIAKPAPIKHVEEKTKDGLQPAPAESSGPSNAVQAAPGTAVGGIGAAAPSADGVHGTGVPGGGPVERTFGSSDGPSFLRRAMPVYPSMARQLARQGNVLLRLTIDESGRTVKVEVMEKAGFGFDEAAVKAAKESTFVPAKMEGRPSPCRVLLPIRFVLKDG
jgi:protein TonB